MKAGRGGAHRDGAAGTENCFYDHSKAKDALCLDKIAQNAPKKVAEADAA